MAPQFIFTMRGLSRFDPPDRQVLEGIDLSFYPGAKIGVLGANGSGKFSLLRVMAGEDDGYSGEARLAPGFTAGLLHQEPRLDPEKDVLRNVTDGLGETATLLERYDGPDLLLLDELTNHLDAQSVAWLERFLSGGHRRRRHPRPLLPGQRRRVDPRAGPGPRHPLGGQLLVVARAEGSAPRARGEDRLGPAPNPRAGARVDPPVTPRPAGPGQGARERLRRAGRGGRGRAGARGPAPHLDPARSASRRPGRRGRPPREGLRRPAADRRPVVLAPARRDRRRHRCERRGQDRLRGDHRRDRPHRRRWA